MSTDTSIRLAIKSDFPFCVLTYKKDLKNALKLLNLQVHFIRWNATQKQPERDKVGSGRKQGTSMPSLPHGLSMSLLVDELSS